VYKVPSKCPKKISPKCSLHFLEVSHISMTALVGMRLFLSVAFLPFSFLRRSPRKVSIFAN